MEKSFKTVFPSPKFNKCESFADKNHLSHKLPLLVPAYNGRALIVTTKCTKNTQDLGVMNKNIKRKFCKTQLQRNKMERIHYENSHIQVKNSNIDNSHFTCKLNKLNSIDDIATWREERRKRYPTLANVLLKQKAVEQKLKRGESLQSNVNRFGKTSDKKRARFINNVNAIKAKKEGKSGKRSQKHSPSLNVEKNVCKTKTPNTEPVLQVRKDNLHKQRNENTNKINALYNISQLYGSSDNSELENESDCNKTNQSKSYDKRTENLLNEKYSKRIATSVHVTDEKNLEQNSPQTFYEKFAQTDEEPDEIPITHEVKDVIREITKQGPKAVEQVASQRKHKCQWPRFIQSAKSILYQQRAYVKKQNTILEKLLESNQRHERNVLLQCVRFVCINNFFNKCN